MVLDARDAGNASGAPGITGAARRAHRLSATPLSVTGVLLAVVGYLVSLTPSLVPRTTAVQVLTSVVLATTGYALGALLGAVARLVVGRAPQPPTRWLARLLGGLVVVALLFTPVGIGWLQHQHDAVGWPTPSWPFVVVLVPLLVAALVSVGRGVRAVARATAVAAGRVVPALPARIAGVVLASALVGGTLVGLVMLAAAHFERLDASTAEQTPPTSAGRSGGPGATSTWETLGRQGRYFVSDGPTAAQISAFTGRPALDPIRVYAGQAAASTPQDRADLVVDELTRTGAFDRRWLVIVVTSGLGSVHPVAATTLEYVADGDVATAATQLSPWPSWLTMVLRPDAAEREARSLLAAVEAAVQARPPAQRPNLVLYAESLGAFGSQQVLSGLTPQEVAQRFDAVLWAGSPAASRLLDEWVRSPGQSKGWQLVIGDGTIARMAATPEDIPADDPTWGPRRILFLQTSSDPVARLSRAVAFDRPAWLDPRRPAGAAEGMVWWPVFTYQQLLVDLTTNGIVPPGWGHNYSHAHAAAWAAVLHQPGWTPQRLEELTDYRRSHGSPDPGQR